MNILADRSFEKGFNLKGLNSIRDGHKAIKEFRLTGDIPDWYLCQWNSKYNLESQSIVTEESGYSIGDKGKRLTVNTKDNELIFRLNASKEYDRPRAEEEGWPHLLIEQDILTNNQVKNVSRIKFEGEFRLNHLIDFMEGENLEHHTAQFVWVVVLKNVNKNSVDYERFVWVVLCPFDSRYDYPPHNYAQDKALPDGEFIYAPDAKDFLDKPMTVGKWVSLSFDLYPYIDDILKKAKANGFLVNTTKEDLNLMSTNIGFEVTGTYDVEISMRKMGLFME